MGANTLAAPELVQVEAANILRRLESRGQIALATLDLRLSRATGPACAFIMPELDRG